MNLREAAQPLYDAASGRAGSHGSGIFASGGRHPPVLVIVVVGRECTERMAALIRMAGETIEGVTIERGDAP